MISRQGLVGSHEGVGKVQTSSEGNISSRNRDDVFFFKVVLVMMRLWRIWQCPPAVLGRSGKFALPDGRRVAITCGNAAAHCSR